MVVPAVVAGISRHEGCHNNAFPRKFTIVSYTHSTQGDATCQACLYAGSDGSVAVCLLFEMEAHLAPRTRAESHPDGVIVGLGCQCINLFLNKALAFLWRLMSRPSCEIGP